MPGHWLAMPKQQQPNGTPGKKPPAPSLKLRLARTRLEQRSGSKPLEPSGQRQSTEAETGQRSRLVSGRRERG
jgi:hypothetical protein